MNRKMANMGTKLGTRLRNTLNSYKLDEKRAEKLIKILLISFVILFITILIIKRFVYFRPSSHFLSTTETYKVIVNGHLHCWLLESQREKSGKIIVICNGNGGNVSHHEHRAIPLRDMGHDVLLFDYSGYGKSKGVPSEQQLFDDASFIVALLRKSYKPEQIVLYGYSMGASVATYTAVRYSIPLIVLESPLPSIKELIKFRYPYVSFMSFLFPEFDTTAHLKGYKGKSLVLHSLTDQIIPYNSITTLKTLCSSHTQMDGTHSDPLIPWDNVNKFINEN